MQTVDKRVMQGFEDGKTRYCNSGIHDCDQFDAHGVDHLLFTEDALEKGENFDSKSVQNEGIYLITWLYSK